MPTLTVVTAILACLLPVTLAYDRPNDLPLGSVNPTAFSCGNACRTLLREGIQADRTTVFGDIPFSYDFYATSHKFSSSSTPGDLLKAQPYIHIANSSAWGLPGGTTLYRIQYVSLSANDEVVPTTAFVAFPFAKPIGGGPFDMVAFAHGTIGTTYGCAPSSTFNLYDYDTVIPLLLNGFAVVGADYAGLGNNYTRPYWEANSLNANDVIFSAVAAKKAFPKLLSGQWVAAGHSQGGGTAWGVGESALLKKAKALGAECIGSVALEPGVRFADEVAYATQISTTPGAPAGAAASAAVYTSFVFAAVQVFQPSVIKDIFTDIMIERQVLGNKLGMCFYLEASIVGDLAASQGLTALIKNFTLLGETLQQYQAAYGAGTGKTAKVPMLVVQSVADLTVPYPIVEIAWQTTCAAGGQPLEFNVYQALDHSPMAAASAPDWLKWIQDRFAGVEGPKKCKVRRRQAVNVNDALITGEDD
jgi:pimeloyl-ACP methyl ester carboxylesterase